MRANTSTPSKSTSPNHSKIDKKQVLSDFYWAEASREASILCRKEVLNGRAKFGISGEGKELGQIALANAMKPGDSYAGYYRDQTAMFKLELGTIEEYFAQLYADVNRDSDITTLGLQMVGFSATPNIDSNGDFLDLKNRFLLSSDTSPTASQMPRALGLALAAKLYRVLPAIKDATQFSRAGKEVTFCTIGDASTSEGHFWEAINAAGVLQVPLVTSVWDDGYGISVERRHQTTKDSISEILGGFAWQKGSKESNSGLDIYKVNGYDYQALHDVYQLAAERARLEHRPSVIHVANMTQPQGHSTSGSHERYKSPERLKFEIEFDPIKHFFEWIINQKIATKDELAKLSAEAKEFARTSQKAAWSKYRDAVDQTIDAGLAIAARHGISDSDIAVFKATPNPTRRDIMRLLKTMTYRQGANTEIANFITGIHEWSYKQYNSNLYAEDQHSALLVHTTTLSFPTTSELVNGNQIIRSCMDSILSRDSRVVIFGEDVGIGDVNHGLVGLANTYGSNRVFDTGIREQTIVGQALGLAMRGLRPIAEIQYLDYLLYGFQTLSDDLASLRYRNRGRQAAPVIIRTRGHRLEGIWHTGSPMGMIINGLRGIYICVPRNMTQAAGFYNTMLRSNDPAIIIECLNGYGVKEPMPMNIGDYTVALGVPEILRVGTDVTIVTYGTCCRIVCDAAQTLSELGISAEVIDAQTILPFDRFNSISASLSKTSRLVIVDEDVPGGASAYMLRDILERQGGFKLLDSPPVTVTASENRTPYGSDGDYFTKPSVDSVIESVYSIMRDGNPNKFPQLF